MINMKKIEAIVWDEALPLDEYSRDKLEKWLVHAWDNWASSVADLEKARDEWLSSMGYAPKGAR